MMPYWITEEEELFRTAWVSGKYDPQKMEEIFQRSFDALRAKAKSLGFDPWETVAARVRVETIRRMLDEAHVI